MIEPGTFLAARGDTRTGRTGAEEPTGSDAGGLTGVFAALLAQLRPGGAQAGGSGAPSGAPLGRALDALGTAEQALRAPDLSDAEITDILNDLAARLAPLLAPLLPSGVAGAGGLASAAAVPPRQEAAAVPVLRQMLASLIADGGAGGALDPSGLNGTAGSGTSGDGVALARGLDAGAGSGAADGGMSALVGRILGALPGGLAALDWRAGMLPVGQNGGQNGALAQAPIAGSGAESALTARLGPASGTAAPASLAQALQWAAKDSGAAKPAFVTDTATAAPEGARPAAAAQAAPVPGPLAAPLAAAQVQDSRPQHTAPPPATQEILSQLRAQTGNQGQIRVELRPDGLGRVEIDLTPDKTGQLRVEIRIENPAVLAALRQDRDGLMGMLRDAGHAVGDQGLNFGEFGQRGPRQGQDAGGTEGSDTGAGAPLSEAPDASQSPAPARTGGVDLNV
ncbi:flagellar hook-length control protein FliK [Brevirhabdus sp.]|uniref:flagellar hook-length control protein FliK n=1 Tax=Brevirhabdus sp. TaxID=2004514 RepID=UPI00405A3A6B